MTEDEKEFDALTYAFPPGAGRFNFILGMIACFGCGAVFFLLVPIHLWLIPEPLETWKVFAFPVFGAILYLIGIFGALSRHRDQQHRKKMILQHEQITADLHLKERN